jgi:hypothetical protein
MLHFVDSAAEQGAVRAELETRHAALAGISRRAEAAVTASLAPSTERGWRGPAQWAFQTALATLRREASAAVEAVRVAERLAEAALYELERGELEYDGLGLGRDGPGSGG